MSGNTQQKRRIAIFTGGRAEYGLLRPLIRELLGRASLDVGLFVGGSHFSEDFGNTAQEIEADGFPIWARIESHVDGDGPAEICQSMAKGCVGVSQALERHSPDLLVLLGDRFELFAAAQAAMIHRVPIAHLHGGEATEGLIDEAIRHAITKLSHLHFVAAEAYRDRVMQMGEAPSRVMTVGALGLDNILSLPRVDRAEMEGDLGIPLSAPLFVVTYHPVTLLNRSPQESVKELAQALTGFPDATIVITFPNSDTHGREIIGALKEFVASRPHNAVLVKSLGANNYLSLLAIADVVIGNSSSGIIEAPCFGIPTVNLGLRQHGRIRAASVIDCDEEAAEIETAIGKALDRDFKIVAKSAQNPYGDGHAAKRIADAMISANLDDILLKSFVDMT